MSPDARRCMEKLAEAYVGAGFPSFKTISWNRQSLGSANNELQALRLLQPMNAQSVRFTEAGLEWAMSYHRMPKEIRWARALFSVFEEGYAKQTSGEWWFPTIDHLEADKVGIDPQQTQVAVKILLQKGLIDADASEERHLKLTDLGKDTCLHPYTLDDRLAPRSTGRLVNASTTNVFHGPAQVGDGNVQNVTNAIIIQHLIEQIEKDPTVTPDQKSRWVDTLKDIAASGVGSAISSALQTFFG
jgi:hypothetical protein